MLTQIKNARFYLQAKLGQRGAEMVEYAIVLACIAAIGVAYYHSYYIEDNTNVDTFRRNLDSLFLNIKVKVKDEI
ncbi:hypothetical protein [Phascolarctobacterium succinatutens]|uniref:hypothetical protein n=1 Tax=Phascolarctobacterium succinatutens TaxID=626940 RepID=UPI0026EEF719|nr:hypothetical protein [Phascolarctobacterium succinatutens]